MPPIDAELRSLRDAIARIERSGEELSGRGSGRISRLSEEQLTLDTALGGGLRCGTLGEITASGARDAAAAAGFAAALGIRCAGEEPLIWIVDDRVAWETGVPYGSGLAAYGLDPDKLLLVRTHDAQSTLWATEEALRAGTGIVLTELWRGQAYDLAASRRLLLAARRGRGISLLLHVGLEAEDLSSAADTRFVVAALPSERRPSAGGRLPIPGKVGFAVRLLKRRGGASETFGAFDRDAMHRLIWDPARRSFGALQPWMSYPRTSLEPADHSVSLGQGWS